MCIRCKTTLSAPKSNLETTCNKFSALMHRLKYFIWGINANLLSKITPWNFYSWTIGMALIGSTLGRRIWKNIFHCQGIMWCIVILNNVTW